jgi:RNA polymerase sigma-70 factor (ECF subfamily)
MDELWDVYERHHLAVYKLALFLTGDPGRAEDLAADTFVRAWTARHRIRHHTVRAYLLTITRNLYRDQLRTGRPLLVDLDEAIADESPGADARVEHASNLQSLRTRLRRIAPGDRRALLLYVVREMSYADIAKTLGVSVGAVKSRIARAREALRTAGHITQNGEGPS